MDQQHAWLHVCPSFGAVDRDRDLHLRAHSPLAIRRAAASARRTKTSTTFRLYSALPRASLDGSAAWAASRAASANASSVGSAPRSAVSASRALTFRGPTAVRPTPAEPMRP